LINRKKVIAPSIANYEKNIGCPPLLVATVSSQSMTVGSVCVSAEELEEGRILGMEVCTEEEFLDKIQTKFLRVFLHAIHCHLS
jgi:hypothetical protein